MIADLLMQDKHSHSFLVRLYYQKRIFMGFCCVSCEVLYLMVSCRHTLPCDAAHVRLQEPCFGKSSVAVGLESVWLKHLTCLLSPKDNQYCA